MGDGVTFLSITCAWVAPVSLLIVLVLKRVSATIAKPGSKIVGNM